MISMPPTDAPVERPRFPEHPLPDENSREFEKRRIDWVLTHYIYDMSKEEIAERMLAAWDSIKYQREALQHRDKKFAEINLILNTNWSK